jgi:predicted ABC-type ATPase
MVRPILYVLAGVNGAGKSSIGGYLLTQAGLAWFNPDTFARELVGTGHCGQSDANIAAWNEGVRRLDRALADRAAYAFETTLGGNTIAEKLLDATRSHDVVVWYCGLTSPEHHISRVKARVAIGGHDIPEKKIRERFDSSRRNLLALMPHLAYLRVYDNSQEAAPGTPIPEPSLLLEMKNGVLRRPATIEDARNTPDWAKPLLEGAFSCAQPIN